jgi:hypothetical protein
MMLHVQSRLRIKTVSVANPEEFFGRPLPSNPQFSNPSYEDFLEYQGPEEQRTFQNATVWRILQLLNRVHMGSLLHCNQNYILSNEIAQHVFQIIGYERPGTHEVALREKVTLCMGGPVPLRVDVAVKDAATDLVFLVGQETSAKDRENNPMSELILLAIAAAQEGQALAKFLNHPAKKTVVRGSFLLAWQSLMGIGYPRYRLFRQLPRLLHHPGHK